MIWDFIDFGVFGFSTAVGWWGMSFLPQRSQRKNKDNKTISTPHISLINTDCNYLGIRQKDRGGDWI